jgi:membrane protease YdiL (CAAX protease family)
MTTADRLIQPSPRSSVIGTALTCLAVILLSIIPFTLRISTWAVVFAVLLAVAALLIKEIQALHIAFFVALFTVLPLLHSSLRKWPFNFLLPIILYLAVVLSFPPLRKSLLWFKTGRFGKDIALLVVATAMISGIALYIWYWLLNPDLSVHLGYMPSMPLWLFPLAGIGFSISNAAMEEFVFRGVIMQATDSAFGTGWLSVIVQAWLFGAVHYLQGFPNGWWGFAMTLVYGTMLGAIRRRAQGMLAPGLAHVCADMVIFAILAAVALRK